MEEEKLNHIVKDKIKKIEDKLIPNLSWTKEKSWSKIKEILDTKNKQLIMWYFAAAASISVLIAATYNNPISYFLPLEDGINPTELVTIPTPNGINITNNEISDIRKIDTKEIKKKEFSRYKKKRCVHSIIPPTSKKRQHQIESNNSILGSVPILFFKQIQNLINKNIILLHL